MTPRGKIIAKIWRDNLLGLLGVLIWLGIILLGFWLAGQGNWFGWVLVSMFFFAPVALVMFFMAADMMDHKIDRKMKELGK